MSAMYRLKAYFGMVPAEEMAEYTDDPAEHYGPARRGYADERWERRDEGRRDEGRWDEGRRDEGRWDDERRPSYDDERLEPLRADAGRPDWGRPRPAERPAEAPRGMSGLGPGAVRGALAVDPDTVLREPPRVPTPVPPPAVPEQRDRAASGPVRITTLQPASYREARTIGEHYRDGQPVIMNLTELDAADAKRLVDFAAGLAFALRGSIDKVTSRVFLLTPADVEVSADDARKLAGVDAVRGVFRQD